MSKPTYPDTIGKAFLGFFIAFLLTLGLVLTLLDVAQHIVSP